jgi:cytosine/adenosine deaminase-related metal-dependent hydrolase
MSDDTRRLAVTGCDVLVRPGDLREGVDILIEDGLIAEVAPAGATAPPAGVPTLQGTGHLAIPGLVNAHTHSPENALRGAGEGLPLELWLARMFGTSGRFAPDDHYACALFGALEMLRTGTTAVVDHLWGTPIDLAGFDAAMRAYRDIGIRAAVAPLVVDHDSTGDLAADHGVDLSGALFTDFAGVLPVAEQQALLEEAIGRWHGREDGRLRVFAGPCAAQWCTDELLVALAETASRHDTCVHLHLLESPLQVPICRRKFGVGAVQGLDRLGLLGPRTSLAHGIQLDEADIALLADRGSVIVHNPSSNLRTGSGRAPVHDLLAAGVPVALGADGPTASDNQLVWTQVKLAALIHNDGFDRWVSGSQALAMATAGGGAALGMGDRIGAIEPGMAADLVLVDRGGFGLAGVQELEAGLALSETGWGVRHVVVDGRVVVREGRCVTVDEEEVRRELGATRDARRDDHAHPPPATLQAMEKLDRFRRMVLGGGAGHQTRPSRT